MTISSLPPSHAARSASRRAFTLIELLVVITIIAVLAAILLPVVSRVMVNARVVQTKNIEIQVVNAVKAFQTDYGKYPIPLDNPGTFPDVCFGIYNPKASELFDILRADNLRSEIGTVRQPRINTRGVVYAELPMAKNQTQGQSKNGIGPDGLLYDPWGKPILVGVDADYSDTMPNPYSKDAGDDPLHLGVIAYSYGPDAKSTSNFFGGSNKYSKNDPDNKDDVISWQ